MHCPVCGGTTTCPAGDKIVAVKNADILHIPAGEPIPAGYVMTHRTKRYRIAVPKGATLAGTAQSGRIVAHNPHLTWVWVGQCTYAFVPREEGRGW